MIPADQAARFAAATVSVRMVQGFMTARHGWMPFLDEIGLLSKQTGPDGLFRTREEALRAGEAFKRQCRVRMAA
ncbi:MAG: hypothetical protein HQL99_14130 [Magnetococcales bacterium]|nr:hypothetical protein [Magnetococcales bacterium]